MGGANRIELCSALSEGGLTPSHGLIQEAIRRSELPVHVLLRPRGGNFIYTDAEFAVMREDLKHMRLQGVSGVVLGILHKDATVDVERTCELVAIAGPLDVTFHRAFDQISALNQALEDVISTGCGRVLTSGGERDVVSGAQSLARLVKQAEGRIEIAVGGGLRLDNAAAVARATGAHHFHGSMRRIVEGPIGDERPDALKNSDLFAQVRWAVESSDVRKIIENLRNA